MYVAMNRFKVNKESTTQFEQVWLSRESFLHTLNGFKEFHLLRGPVKDDYALYSSYTLWQTYEDFVAWTQSDAFKTSHKRADNNKAQNPSMYLGHPEFEGFETIQTLYAPTSIAAE